MLFRSWTALVLASKSLVAQKRNGRNMGRIAVVGGKVFFNLEFDVGRASPNRLDDVELVQYGYFCTKVNPKLAGKRTPRLQTALNELRPKGLFGPDLQEIISAHQEARGGTIDGKITVAKPQSSHTSRYDGTHTWMIFNLCESMFDRAPLRYPRIDLDEVVGDEIARKIAFIFNL